AEAERMLRAGVLHGDVGDAFLVQQPPQLEVDLPRRERMGIEGRALAVDLGDPRSLRVRLCEAARVVCDAALSGYRRQTITSPSKGSYVSISRSRTARIAISSDASATMSSPSY